MSFRALNHWIAVGLLLVSGCVATTSNAWGQEELKRRVKTKVVPSYPELARRMNITGVVRIQVTVDKNGTVKSTKLVGGHPVLANASLDAVAKWKYEPGSEETTGIVEFHFDPDK